MLFSVNCTCFSCKQSMLDGPPDTALPSRGKAQRRQTLYCDVDCPSVVLAYVTVGPFKQVGILVQLVAKQRLAQCLLDLAFPCMRCLPAVEPHRAHDLVDVVDDPPYHDGRVAVPRFLEQLSEGSLPPIDVLFLRRLALRFHHVLRERQKLLQEIDR